MANLHTVVTAICVRALCAAAESIRRERDLMHSMERRNLCARLISGAMALGLFMTASSVCHASFPGFPGRGPVYHYGYGWNPCNAPQAPTTRTIKNNLWQSKQWKGEYPVCQPLYAPNFGHFQTQWHRFPGDECFDSPSMAVHPF